MQQEIVDETDIYEDMNTGSRRNVQRADVANFLAMFEHKLHHSQVNSLAEKLMPGLLCCMCNLAVNFADLRKFILYRPLQVLRAAIMTGRLVLAKGVGDLHPQRFSSYTISF